MADIVGVPIHCEPTVEWPGLKVGMYQAAQLLGVSELYKVANGAEEQIPATLSQRIWASLPMIAGMPVSAASVVLD